jgi:hypothetical protein
VGATQVNKGCSLLAALFRVLFCHAHTCVYALQLSLQGAVCQTAIICLSGLLTWLCKSSEGSDYSLLGW